MNTYAGAQLNLRQSFEAGEIVLAPGVFDMISARIADDMGFKAIYMTGYGVAASALGLPDAGLATLTDMEALVRRIARGTTTPLIADGDTGYGGLLNVQFTVRSYEAAGASAIQLEDQEFPKKCGHTPGRRVIEAEEMVKKIRVAVETRSSSNFLIIARTDARTELGLDEALRRAELYGRAGADLLFIEAPESEEEMAVISERIDLPLVANLVEGGKTPLLPLGELKTLGYRLVLYPATGFLAVGAALQSAYSELRTHGTTQNSGVQLQSFSEFNRLVGFDDVWEFDRRWAE